MEKAPRTTGNSANASKTLSTAAGLIVARREGRVRWSDLNVAPFKEVRDR